MERPYDRLDAIGIVETESQEPQIIGTAVLDYEQEREPSACVLDECTHTPTPKGCNPCGCWGHG